jgi:hypothetical protein
MYKTRFKITSILFYLHDKFMFQYRGKVKSGQDVLNDLERYPILTKHFGPK